MRMLNSIFSTAGVALTLVAVQSTAFQPAPRGISNAPSNPRLATSSLKSYSLEDDDEGYEIRGFSDANRPETTFGAENVPVEQRPSNEYLNLIRQPTFGWASQESGDSGLAVRLAIIYAAFFGLVCYPISGATWVNEGYLLQKLTASNVGAISVVFVLVLRLYSGWGYIGSRLKSKVIEYEETGWYDGDIEEKSESEKARDLFLYRSNVQPVEDRLKKFCLAVGGTWVASCIALNVATSVNPLFNQYDPSMLEKLSYDDKVAEVVQKQSNGRPTYCESRYYRAVANGGQEIEGLMYDFFEARPQRFRMYDDLRKYSELQSSISHAVAALAVSVSIMVKHNTAIQHMASGAFTSASDQTAQRKVGVGLSVVWIDVYCSGGVEKEMVIVGCVWRFVYGLLMQSLAF